jgi:DNA-binding SARP family transcriptional activator
MEVRLLGPVELEIAGARVDVGGPRAQAVLALLAVRAGEVVTADWLIDQLWGERPPRAARITLQSYISRLRRLAVPDSERLVPRHPRGYRLDPSVIEVDASRFIRLSEQGRGQAAAGRWRESLQSLRSARALWRGAPFTGIDEVPALMAEHDCLEELRLETRISELEAALEIMEPADVIGPLQELTDTHPWHERGWQLLLLALYRAGRQPEALEAGTRVRRLLAEEHGLDPSSGLAELEHRILVRDPALGTDRQRREWLGISPAPFVGRKAELGELQADWEVDSRGHRSCLVLADGEPGVGTSHCELVVAPRAATIASAPVEEQNIFIGREVALQRLVDALAGSDGRGRVVLVAGEPGIGKTRLLRRFTELANVSVVWGACPEHVAAPPLWPWEQVLRAVRTRCPDRQVPGPVAELLVGQFGEVVEVSDVAGTALRRFEAIGQYLAAGPDPLVVVLDDVHWADLASLRLLEYLADTITANRLLLVASYRSHECAALAEALASLARANAGRIELTGLSIEETQALASAVAGREVSKDTAERLWARTEGNPFYLRELIGLLASEHRLDQPEVSPVPVPVREVVLRRIARLPEATAAVLSVAAIAGRDFDVDVVAEVALVEVDAVLKAIDTAVAAGLVVEDPRRLGWFRFTHALIDEALYEATTRARRVRRHRRIGVAAARLWAGHDECAAEIARHWLLAAELDANTAAQAAAYAATAAHVAEVRLAPEDAATLWRQALAVAELASDDVDRYPLLMGLATSLYRAGNPRDGLPVFVQAMEYVLDEDDSHVADISQLINAVVAAIGESNWYPVVGSIDDERLVDVLKRALPRLTDPGQQALLLASLATARYYDDNPQRRVALSDRALALVRPMQDAVALARVLHLRALALYGPDYPDQCLGAATELLELPGVPASLVASARRSRVRLFALLGRISESAAELDLFDHVVGQSGSPAARLQLGWSRAGLLLLAGRWQEADATSLATYHLHSGMSYGAGQGVAQGSRMIQRWEAKYLAGTGADLTDELHTAVEATGSPTLRSILTMALVEAGRLEEARAVLRCLVSGPKDYRWLYNRCWGLLAAARLGETARVVQLRDQLLPYRRLACAVFTVVVSGSVAYFTGEAALALGDADAALADLAIATEADKAMGALPWLAQAHDATRRTQCLRQAAKGPAKPQ